jgi:pimeloyl-ACP methyl ester carboxylesterase
MNYSRPDSLFTARYASVEKYKIHYLDEGNGDVILFVHGIPEWSLLYVDIIKMLSKSYRCIVPDHLGFGYSDKDSAAILTPEAHAERLCAFIDHMQLKDIHLVVHDYGGPIGMGALIKKPELFRTLTICNTWLWDLSNATTGKRLRLMQGAIGKWLYLRYGFSVKVMSKNAFADKKTFIRTKNVFMYPHQTETDRFATYQLMLEMLNSGGYFDYVLNSLRTLDISSQLVWGMKDPFFSANDFLCRWKTELPDARIVEIPDSGHFPHIESPEQMAEVISEFVIISKDAGEKKI